MSTVFKRAGRTKWHYKVKLPNGKWVSRVGFTDKRATERLASDEQAKIDRGEVGLVDTTAKHRKRPVGEHVEDFVAYVHSRRKVRTGARGEKHSRMVRNRLLRAFEAMEVGTLDHLTIDAVQLFLGALLDQGRKTKTRNDYLSDLRHFADWAEDDGRIAKSPIRSNRKLPRLDSSKDRKRRQAVTWQAARDLSAAMVQRSQQRAPKKNREHYVELARGHALIVTMAHLTGLRHNELANATWRWFNLKSETLTIPAEVQGKSGRTSVVPLHSGLVQLLRAERRRRAVVAGRAISQDDLVVGAIVNGTPKLPRHIADRIRAAAEWVELPVTDEKGRTLDLHAMRKSFNVNLRRCGASKEARVELMRHAVVGVTDEHYDDPDLDQMRAAVNMIPAEAANVAGLFEGVEAMAPNMAPNFTPLRAAVGCSVPLDSAVGQEAKVAVASSQEAQMPDSAWPAAPIQGLGKMVEAAGIEPASQNAST